MPEIKHEKFEVPFKIRLLSFFGIAKTFTEQHSIDRLDKNQRVWIETIKIEWKEKEYIVSQKLYTYKLS